tara:strand:- start:282 stop:491 length:210 start_codon:yes stop_codon:yes gene_type:complete
MTNSITQQDYDMIKAVDVHAIKYYEDTSNWDVWIECYDLDEKRIIILGALNVGDAIARAGKALKHVSIY